MKKTIPSLEIMDVTLRDGSYAINFQFSAGDTAIIARHLEEAGVRWIEIGHGAGLNASHAGLGQAAETDAAYLKAASRVLKKARSGVFCIPGIARLENVDMAADLGAGFIRIGTEVAHVRQSKRFIERARKRGLFVAANLMKSYALSPAEFAKKARLSHDYGADLLYVVDSAGGMLPIDVENYFTAVREVCAIPLGFHGHDNLRLAVGNSLRAAEIGARIVDSSLQGLGRSAGNAPTEILVPTLEKAGFHLKINSLALMEVGEKYVRPLIRRRGLSSLDIVTGQAQFHSSYMGIIQKFSSKHQVDPRKLILALTQVDKVNAPEELVERIARKLRSTGEIFTARFEFDEYYGHEQSSR